MLLDLQSLRDGALPIFDFCVIGAGAAGITLAIELEKAGKLVCVLESGGEKFESKSQALCAVDDAAMLSGGLTGRLRM